MSETVSLSFLDAVQTLAPLIETSVLDNERNRRLSMPVVEGLAHAGLFRLWIPRDLGGEGTDPMTLLQVVEAVSRLDAATGWCVMIGACYGAFAGYLPINSAREIYGADPNVITGGAFRPSGTAVLVDGGFRVTGRWSFGSGCQHCAWLVGGCLILDGDQPRLRADGTQLISIMFFPAASCEILDTWDSIGLRGTGSHDYVVKDLFVPNARSVSFRDPPARSEPLYALPSIALFGTIIAAVPLGIARHAIDILTGLAGGGMSTRSRGTLKQNAMLQADLGRAEALVRSGRAFLFDALDEAWRVVSSGQKLSLQQRAMLWLAATHATTAATQAVDMMFSSGGSSAVYARAGLERCVRDIRAVGQHVTVTPSNFEMIGQALLGADMRASSLLALDDRG